MNFQQIILVGRATKDAEVLKSKAGKDFAKFNVAVNEYHDKEEEVTFYEVLVFGKTVKIAGEKIKKGDVVMTMGKPEVNAYVSKKEKGVAKGSIVVLAESWQALK